MSSENHALRLTRFSEKLNLVRVPSGFGLLFAQYENYCNAIVGQIDKDWAFESYIWEYEFWFKRSEDATAFLLKWK